MKTKLTLGLLVTSASLTLLTSAPAQAEDWTLFANSGCRTTLGNTQTLVSGLKATGGSAVVSCPITKEVVADAFINVYARIDRAVANGPDPFCVLNTVDIDGEPQQSGYRFAQKVAGYQSLSLPKPTHYASGYADIICTLNNNDMLHGIRYRQKN